MSDREGRGPGWSTSGSIGRSARGVVRDERGGAIIGEGLVPADEDGLAKLVLRLVPVRARAWR